jgi:hypothetical protein
MVKDRNLVILKFPLYTDANLINILQNLQQEYQFDLMYHKAGTPREEFYGEYPKRLFIYHGDTDEDFKTLLKELEQNKKEIIIDEIILSSNSDCRKWMNLFGVDKCLNVSNKEESKNILREVFAKVFLYKDKRVESESEKIQPEINIQENELNDVYYNFSENLKEIKIDNNNNNYQPRIVYDY